VSDRRSLTVRDMPTVFVIFGGILAAGTVGIPFAERLDMPSERDLVSVSGQVVSIDFTNRPKAGRKLQIALQSSDRILNLTQEDMSAAIPVIASIKPGNKIDARVRHDLFGRDLEWLWVLNRDGKTLVSYQETEHFLQVFHARTIWLTYGAGLLSVCLIVAAVAMRLRFGAWRSAT
jgi:hypothetical protein